MGRKNPGSALAPGGQKPGSSFATRCIAEDDRLNLRDLGGLPVAGGRYTGRGALFRSGALLPIALESAARPKVDLSLRSYVDLRTQDEANRDGWDSQLEEIGVSRICAPLSIPKFRELLGPAPQPSHYARAYVRLVQLGADQVSAALAAIAAAPWPLVFGCSLGKDRTGVIASLVLLGRGVRCDIVARDHALSARQLSRGTGALSTDRLRKGLSPPAYARRLAATPASMARFLDWWTDPAGSEQKALAARFAPSLQAINRRWPLE
jgi:protein-tyrosine phosphatase